VFERFADPNPPRLSSGNIVAGNVGNDLSLSPDMLKLALSFLEGEQRARGELKNAERLHKLASEFAEVETVSPRRRQLLKHRSRWPKVVIKL